jgi:hypothetical protein
LLLPQLQLQLQLLRPLRGFPLGGHDRVAHAEGLPLQVDSVVAPVCGSGSRGWQVAGHHANGYY